MTRGHVLGRTDNTSHISKLVSPDVVLGKIEPGMSIFLGTGVAEPRTLVKNLVSSNASNLTDLDLIQLVSLGDAISAHGTAKPGKFRLKTFFSGWLASEAITMGTVDLIPSRISRIPFLIESGIIGIDVVFIQITPFDEAGYASLGIALDAAKYAMEKASLVVGEINPHIPRTMGNTFVHIDEFDFLISATEPPIYFARWPVDEVMDKVATNVASVVEDGSCLAFYSGPLFEALGRHLIHKRDLGVHTFFFTDALMDLVKCGAVTNRRKGYFRGKSLTSYAQGTPELLKWLHLNPLVEFQSVDIVADHYRISLNDRMAAILPARKVDLTGNIALHIGRGNVALGPGQAMEFFAGAEHSRRGRSIFALPSRNLQGKPNILMSLDDLPGQFTSRETLDMIVTEYGIASMAGKTIRERAQALIDIAHPGDRAELVRQAKEAHVLYLDQIYLAESATLYPEKLSCAHTFKDGLTVQFRAIKPSDEEGMRQLFYRFSEKAVYYRYFSETKAMPHIKLQEYVNVDYRNTLSLVGLVEEEGRARIIAEGRYVIRHDRPFADTAFVVDESWQERGVASLLLHLLIEAARERGVEGFSADVLADNLAIIKVFEKTELPVQAYLAHGLYHLTIPFTDHGLPTPIEEQRYSSQDKES